METNVLYYGDNLKILRNREYFSDECIDLIYLDPPFNSKGMEMPLQKQTSVTFNKAQRIKKKEGEQGRLG